MGLRGPHKQPPELNRTLRIQVPVNQAEKEMIRRLRIMKGPGVSEAQIVRDLVRKAYSREESLKKTKAA